MAAHSFYYGEECYPYEVISCRSLTGKIAIHVHPDGIVRVDAPESATAASVKRAVIKRARWIKRQVDLARETKAHSLPREYVSGETHFYLGRRYRLKLQKAHDPDTHVRLSGGVLSIRASSTAAHIIKEHLECWYRARAQEYFSRRIKELTDRISWLDQPPPFRLLKMRRQWGSCSPQGLISLNPALIRAPRDCVEYVIVHELCHLKEHNHSRRYYRLLSQQMSDWQATKVRLDSMAELILGDGSPSVCGYQRMRLRSRPAYVLAPRLYTEEISS
jgi:predicted metal-dependent hydrolase